MSVLITISDDRRENLLISALEGGSNYWYSLINQSSEEEINKFTPEDKKNEPFAIRMWVAIKAGANIPVYDIEGDVDKKTRDNITLLGHINLSSIDKGEQIMHEKHLKHFINIIEDNDDAITADVWFQLAVMGEVVYG